MEIDISGAEDIMSDQITFKEYIDPFTGSKNTKA